MLHAVIFDFDGVIVNSEPLHFQAYQDVLKPRGLGFSWDDYLSIYLGFDDRDCFRLHFKQAGRTLDETDLANLVRAKGEAFLARVERGEAAPYPGVVDLIRKTAGRIPVAICSGALPGDIHPVLDRLGLASVFRVMVTAADVKNSKPDPACYVLTVDKLQTAYPERGIRPGTCVAIEDSPWGITAAHEAGIPVVGVTNMVSAETLKEAEAVVDSLERLSWRDLERLADPKICRPA